MDADFKPLSRRQTQMLCLIAEGYTYPEIMREIGLSHSAVKEHLKVARKKLGARNSTHAVAIAVRAELLPDRRAA